MALEQLRSPIDRLLLPLARLLVGVHPNVLSWVGFGAGVLAAGLIYSASLRQGASGLVLAAAVAIVANGVLDILDGMVARLSRRATSRGDFLDHVLDRYVDVALLVAIYFSGYARPTLVFLALTGVVLTSYMGVQAKAMGVTHLAGLLGRTDRQVVLITALIISALQPQSFARLAIALSPFAPDDSAPITVFDLAMIWFALAGNLTALQRLMHVWRELRGR